MRPIYLVLIVCSLAAAQVKQAAPIDKAGCQDSQVLTRLPGCWIIACKNAAYNAAKMPIADKDPRTKSVEGIYAEVKYSCPKDVAPIQTWREAQAAFRKSGFTQIYENNYYNARFQVTTRKGAQWAHVYADSGGYTLTAVKEKEIDQVLQANADGWTDQINQTGKVSIYGINFDTAKATVRPDSEPVLNELLALLQKQPEWYMLVAGHTDNAGTDVVNLPLSRQRSEAVIAWLVAKGIDKTRLTPAGFGSRKPLADNGSEEGRAKNRRVDLVKLY